jgi:hypothetical protein
LFITARIYKPKSKNASASALFNNEEFRKTLVNGEERIVACINFSLLGSYGYFVNWLATSKESIKSEVYGEELAFLCDSGTWKRRHLALFLMKTANLAVISHLRSKKVLNPDEYYILLQARTTKEEKGHIFYNRIGFQELGSIDNENELNVDAFKGCGELITRGGTLSMDYIHFIYGITDIVLFKNNTGTFGSIRSFSHRYTKPDAEECTEKSTTEENVEQKNAVAGFQAPFPLVRNHFMILEMHLDLVCFPFVGSSEMTDYIEVNNAYTDNRTVLIEPRDIGIVATKDEWLNDSCIDFYVCW